MTGPCSVEIVVPTIGRHCLRDLLHALAAQTVPVPRLVLVDDRPRPGRLPPAPALTVDVCHSGARGPAAARNTGWRATLARWVAFLDDDVVPPPDWFARLTADLDGLDDDVAGSQGDIRVPLPSHRPPTDWERNVAGLERALWATADMAYRREALAAAGGFDERFPRAYREDADIGLRLVASGWRIVHGRRWVSHPVRPTDRWVSLRLQRGNADDALMGALHGPGWREAAAAPAGRFRRHAMVVAAGTAAGLGGVAALVTRRPPGPCTAAAAAAWLTGTAAFAWSRFAPGPHTTNELLTVAATSAAIPPAAVWHRLRGSARARTLIRCPQGPEARMSAAGRVTSAASAGVGVPVAVLLDRDGTLVRDVPYNGDPERVQPMPGARAALDRLRVAGIRLAVVSNQSGIGRGRLTLEQVQAVNRRVEELLGPLGPWLLCPHAPGDGCGCRKPAPGLVLDAAAALGVEPAACALVGDIGADIDAARAAGARAVLVPTAATRPEEVAAAPEVARDLDEAVDMLLGGCR